MEEEETPTLFLCGTLRGHSDMVTAIAMPSDRQPRIVFASRDKSLIVWDLDPLAMLADGLIEEGEIEREFGTPSLRLSDHSHFVQDVVFSSDSMSALSCSLDGDLRLWDLSTGATIRRFVGHNKDVLPVAFSFSNRQIIPTSKYGTFKLWNTLGECKYTIQEADAPDDQEADAHNAGFSCLRFYPSVFAPVIASGLWDGTVKLWNLTNCKLLHTLTGHSGYVKAVVVSPDGTLCASGGKDGVILLWDIAEGKQIYSFDAGAIIHALCFNPNRYWLCAATENNVTIWDLEYKSIVQDLKPDQPPNNNQMLHCTSLNWGVNGNTLFAGYLDGTIMVWGVIDGYSMHELLDLKARFGDVETGLSEDFIVNNLKTHLHEANGVSSYSDASWDDICSICQGKYDVKDCIGTLNCEHIYHSDCIKQWLVLKNQCPICKKSGFIMGRSQDFRLEGTEI